MEPDNPAITAVLAPMVGRYTQVWTFDAATQQYRSYIVGQGGNDFTDLHAQQGYIIHVTQPSAILIAGTRATQDIGLAAGWNLIPCPADSPMPVADALASVAGQYESVWTFDTAGGAWQKSVAGQAGFVSNLDGMEPGRAYWIRMESAALLAFQQQPTRTHFYHPDHLGSSSVVTDDTGAVVERTEFYPYGRLRHEQRANFESAYKFTGKERDSATGLDYFGARYYSPVIGRFISVDFMPGNPGHPQTFNPYGYANNNPLAFIDPRGMASQGLSPDLLDGNNDDDGSDNKGSSMDNWEEDLVKTLLAVGLNVLETAVQDSGAKKYIGYALGGVGLVDMGIEAFESGDWEKMLEFGLGAGETGVGVATGHKLALLEMYQYGKGMVEMGESAFDAASSDFEGAAKYAGVTAGKEVLENGPEGAANSVLNKIKPPPLWQPNGAGAMPMFEAAKQRGAQFLNPYLEQATGYLPLLNQEEKSMVQGSTERMLY